MAANPALSSATQGAQLPALYTQEVIALQREGIDLNIDGLRTSNGRYQSRQSFPRQDMLREGLSNFHGLATKVVSARGTVPDQPEACLCC